MISKSVEKPCFQFLFSSITTLIVTNSIFLAPGSAATIKAEEKAKFAITAPSGNSTYMLSYRVSIADARPPEEITDVTVMGTVRGVPLTNFTITKVDNFNWDVKLTTRIINNASPEDFIFELKTTATEKFKNKLIKKDFSLTRNGMPDRGNIPSLPGFEFKSNSDGIYTLFNDSNESWDVNRLLVRINKSEIDLASFDLDSPDLFLWDFEIDPFNLNPGEQFDLSLNEELLPGIDIFSQAFVEITGQETGKTVLDIQQHQHFPVPEPSNILGTITALGVGCLLTNRRKIRIH